MEKRKRNLYKMDDFCLVLSVILFIVLIYQFRSLVRFLGESDLNLLIEEARFLFFMMPIRLGVLLFSAFFFLIISRVVRKKEKISLEVIDAISYRSKASVSGLAEELGKDVEVLEKVIRQLAALPGAGVSFDGSYVRIDRGNPNQMDDKFTRKEGFGTGNSAASVHSSTSSADYAEKRSENEPLSAIFDKNLSPDEMREKFQNIVQEKKAAAQSSVSMNSSGSSGSNSAARQLKPNIGLLLFLFIAFWPAAFIYLIGFSLKNSQARALQEGINRNKD